MSHAYATDEGNSDYPVFTQAQWYTLFDQLKGINNLYISPTPTADLMTMTLNEFIGDGTAAVIFALGVPDIDLGDYQGQGFYYGNSLGSLSQWGYNGAYSDSDDPDFICSDQINKLLDTGYHIPVQVFLTSWTLTRTSVVDNVAPTLGLGSSPLYDTHAIHAQTWPNLYKNCSPSCYANLICVDSISLKETALAIAMNLNFALPNVAN